MQIRRESWERAARDRRFLLRLRLAWRAAGSRQYSDSFLSFVRCSSLSLSLSRVFRFASPAFPYSRVRLSFLRSVGSPLVLTLLYIHNTFPFVFVVAGLFLPRRLAVCR